MVDHLTITAPAASPIMAGLPYSVSLSQVRKDEILHHSHGRAPWYDMHGTPNQAYVIGIAGGSASGKVRCHL